MIIVRAMKDNDVEDIGRRIVCGCGAMEDTVSCSFVMFDSNWGAWIFG